MVCHWAAIAASSDFSSHKVVAGLNQLKFHLNSVISPFVSSVYFYKPLLETSEKQFYMKFTQESAAGRYQIHSQDARQVVVEWSDLDEQGVPQLNSETLTGSFLLTPVQLRSDDLPQVVSELNTELLQQVVELQIEVLLLGCGEGIEFPAPTVISWLSQRGVGLEVMTSAAACRTYNLLLVEDRRVAALILFDQPGSGRTG